MLILFTTAWNVYIQYGANIQDILTFQWEEDVSQQKQHNTSLQKKEEEEDNI